MPRVLFFLVAVPLHAALTVPGSRCGPAGRVPDRLADSGRPIKAPWKLRIQSSVARKTLRLLEVAE